MTKPANVDEYISTFPAEIRQKLEQIRAVINAAAPHALEVISYGMPAFKLHGMLVWFAAHTKHIGFYPRGSGIAEFAAELKPYKTTKGTVQFPFDEPLPLDLITDIVKFRLMENLKHIKIKRK